MTAPGDCRTMAEVREGVDALDARLVALLAERFRYMEAAARLKPERGQVRDAARKAAVIARVRGLATEAGADPEPIGRVYDALVEASIAYELARWDEHRAT